MKLIVTGSRDWTDADMVGDELDMAFSGYPLDQQTVVHGGCQSGADDMALSWCARNGVKQEIHHADWTRHGSSAGPIRNREMAKAGADLCLAFWNGKSPGTLSMIKAAVECGIPVRIVPRAKR